MTAKLVQDNKIFRRENRFLALNDGVYLSQDYSVATKLQS